MGINGRSYILDRQRQWAKRHGLALQVHVVADAIVQALERSARSKAVFRGLLGSLQVRAGHRLAEIEKELRS